NTLGDEYLRTCVYKPSIFANKVVFVTGGAGSICRVQTEAMIILGADACIIGRNVEKTESAARELATLRPGAKVLGLGNVDVSKIQSIKAAADKAVQELGKIDFVIAGAAGNFLAPFAGLSSRAFSRVIEIDLIGTFNTVKATYEQLRQNKGHVIFVSATLQLKGIPFQSHASAAKAAIDSLVKTLSLELGPLGIQVNAIAPGPIDGTEGMSRLMPADMKERSIKLVPLQTYGSTQDIADSTVYLFSPAGRFISGHVLVVDGAAWFNGGPELELYPESIRTLNAGENKL
ncbi:SDR family oxidoreductase, partial [Macrococcus caseolyticus]